MPGLKWMWGSGGTPDFLLNNHSVSECILQSWWRNLSSWSTDELVEQVLYFGTLWIGFFLLIHVQQLQSKSPHHFQGPEPAKVMNRIRSRDDRKCHTCNKTFSKKEHLTRHIRGHTKERPFVCPVCGKLYSRRYERVPISSCHVY